MGIVGKRYTGVGESFVAGGITCGKVGSSRAVGRKIFGLVEEKGAGLTGLAYFLMRRRPWR